MLRENIGIDSMKKIFIIFIAALLVFTTVTIVLDETSAKADTPSITVLPGSFFYPAKIFLEEVRMENTFRDIGKAKVMVRYAGRRLMESQIMRFADDDAWADYLLKQSVELIIQANEHIKQQALKKDDSRTEVVITDIAQMQTKILETIALLDNNKETDALRVTLDAETIKTMVIKAFVLYKEDYFENGDILESTRLAYEAAKEANILGIDAISVATLALEMIESGAESDLIDAVTAATQEIVEDGTGTLVDGTDATSSATTEETLGAGTQTGSGDTDATSSATTQETIAPPSDGGTTGGGGEDATSSATVVLQDTGDDDEDDDHEEDEHDEDDDHEEDEQDDRYKEEDDEDEEDDD